MMIRGLLFLLFLYTLLVWLVSFILDNENFVKRGLFWTAVGIAVLIAWIVIERIWSWRSTRSPKRPANSAPGPSVREQHPDDAAISAMLSEAERRLAESSSFRGSNTRLVDLPLYLLLGPEGSGKTSVLEASGMEPVLLAGQVAGGGPTRLANLWLAKGSLYLEIGGRIFASESLRFSEFVNCLRAAPVVAAWRKKLASSRWGSWLGAPTIPLNLQGVILFFSARDFIGPPDAAKLERASQQVREKLDAIAANFGNGCPVYVLFSKTDAVPFYQEFFSRFNETEAGQVFGMLNSPAAQDGSAEKGVWAEVESLRIGNFFNALFLRLNARRLLALASEVQAYHKPALYEFPREFKRIRERLVQFLVDVFRPNPLKPSPVLRGFFFTGTRQVERSTPAKRGPGALARPAALEATNIFRSGATEIFSPAMMQTASIGRPPAHMMTSWMFLREFFHGVLHQDRPPLPVPSRESEPPVLRHGKSIFAAVAVVAALLAVAFTWSWFSNRREIGEVVRLIEATQQLPADVSTASLRSLNRLQDHLEELNKNHSLAPHWGLYTGNQLYELGRTAYFGRLKAVLLDGVNTTLAAGLRQPGAAANSSLYDRLKAHITITSKACPPEANLSGVLGDAFRQWQPSLAPEQYELAARQIGYYTSALAAENTPPVRLSGDSAGIGEARDFLRNSGGLAQQLAALLTQVGRQVPPIRMQERIPDYGKVLNGPSEMSGQFTKAGSQLMEQLIDKGDWNSGEACVMGSSSPSLANLRPDIDTKKRLLYRYYSAYADAWRQFLGNFRVQPFASAGDAASKLERIGGSQSPLLSLVKLVAENTNFPAKTGEVSQWEGVAEKLWLGKMLQKKKATEKVLDQVEALSPKIDGLTAGDVTLLFQPVHVTTPPALQTLVSEGNKAYVEGLRSLQQQLDGYSRASEGEEKSALVPGARQALSQAKMGLGTLSDRFANVGSQGLNSQLSDLLDEPLKLAGRWIPNNAKAPIQEQRKGELLSACRDLNGTLKKYPFNPVAADSATLEDIKKSFAPKTGRVWLYQQTLGESVVKQGGEWLAGTPKPQITQELLKFLNQAQQITDAFFSSSDGAGQPHLKYVLRPIPGAPAMRLAIDGTEMNSAVQRLQTTFRWPATAGSVSGASAKQIFSDSETPFGQYDGMWGVFNFFQNADSRAIGEKRVQWSEVRGRGAATAQKLSPPAVVEILEFPGGADLFNPKFFAVLHCPQQAVIRE